jgi:hypothetical protein
MMEYLFQTVNQDDDGLFRENHGDHVGLSHVYCSSSFTCQGFHQAKEAAVKCFHMIRQSEGMIRAAAGLVESASSF